MADAKPENKVGDVTFEENPLEFCQGIYDKAAKYNEERAVDVVADRAFYDGVDPELEKRRNNKSIVRSAIFIPECQSAIDTRISTVLDRGQEDSLLVRLILEDEYAEDEKLQKMVKDKEAILNEQLISSDFLWGVLLDWIKGAELQPLSIVKVGHEDEYEWKAQRDNFVERLMNIPGALINWVLRYGRPPRDKTKYSYELKDSHPTAQWLDWDEFLYLPSAVKLQDLPWVIHRRWRDWNDVCNEAKLLDWNMDKIDEMKIDSGDGEDASEGRISEQVDEKGENSHEKYMKEGKYLISEFHIKTYDRDSREIIKIVTLGNNHFEFKNESSRFPHLGFPFVVHTAWPRLGSIEGDSSIKLVKPLQKIYSDGYNIILDGATYGIFAPMFKESTVDILGTPVWGPAQFIEVSGGKGVDGIKPFEPNIGEIGIIPPLIDSIAAKIRQVLNAPDVDQGLQEGPDEEKATKTRLRVIGSQRRLRPLFKTIEDSIKSVAEMFIKINQHNDPDWILPVSIQIPAYSGVSTPDEERYNALMVYEAALKNPIYANPIGQLKLRELWVDYLNKSRIRDVDARCPTEEELQAIITMEMEMAKNQAIQDTLNSGDNNQNKEAKNAGVETIP